MQLRLIVTWEEMKGEKFALPVDALRGGGRFGGGRPGGDRPAGGRLGGNARPE